MWADFILLPPLSLLLLRYHLLVNDQSHHIKTLRADHLQQLFLTKLKREDYFLHHYLYFCRNYRVIWGFAGLLIASLIYSGLFGKSYWIVWQFNALLFGTCLVLLTWLAGVFQYTFEWRTFAGGRFSVAQHVSSGLLSILLATASAYLSFILMDIPSRLSPVGFILGFAFLALVIPLVLLLVAALVHQQGLKVYRNAEELLWRRFADNDPDWPRKERERKLGNLHWLVPFRRLRPTLEESLRIDHVHNNGGRESWIAAVSATVLCCSFFLYGAFDYQISSFLMGPWYNVGSSSLKGYHSPALIEFHAYQFYLLPVLVFTVYTACRIMRAKVIAVSRSPRLLFIIYGKWATILCLLSSLLYLAMFYLLNCELSLDLAFRFIKNPLFFVGKNDEVALWLHEWFYSYLACMLLSYILFSFLIKFERYFFNKITATVQKFIGLVLLGAFAGFSHHRLLIFFWVLNNELSQEIYYGSNSLQISGAALIEILLAVYAISIAIKFAISSAIHSPAGRETQL